MRNLMIIAALGVAAGSLAAESISTTTFGRGRCEIRGDKDYEIKRVSVVFYRDSRFRIHLNGQDEDGMDGTYRSLGRDRYSLSIDSAFGSSRGSGRGTIEIYRGKTITSLDASGSAGSRSFSVRFTSDRPDEGQGWNRPGGSGDSGSSRGQGSVDLRGRRSRINALSASYDSQGRVRLTLSGETTVTIQGRSAPNDRMIVDSINGQRARGEGRVNNIAKDDAVIELSGDCGGRFSISYRGSRGGSGGHGDGWGGSGGSWNQNGAFSSRDLRGSGRLNYKGDGDDVDRASFDFDSRGRFTISFSGEAKGKIEGRWTRRGDAYSLKIEQYENRDASGTGTLTLSRGGGVSAVMVSARYKDSRLSFSFRTR